MERDLRRSTVTLRIQPAEAAENEEYSNARYMPGWEHELWSATPDEGGDAYRSLIGMMFFHAPNVTGWDEFEATVRDLFVSLAADVPALGDRAPHILWTLTTESGDREVSGLFKKEYVSLQGEVVFNFTVDVDTTEFPTGPESGRRVAETALAIVRGWGLEPEQLRYYLYTPAPVRA
ncbi:hypothetical protein, partial [Actinoplanes couchii]